MVSHLHLQLIATLLRRGAAIDHASSALTLLGLVIGLAPTVGVPVSAWGTIAAVLMLVLGGAEKYWAQRVAIDAELFSVLAGRANDVNAAFNELDTALHELGLAPIDTSQSLRERNALERSRGALRLLRWQGGMLGGQCLVALVACISHLVSS